MGPTLDIIKADCLRAVQSFECAVLFAVAILSMRLETSRKPAFIMEGLNRVILSERCM